MTVVCIAGMHRSGTSMVARLLNLCGLYLGEEADILSANTDNVEGFWENTRFLAMNEEILSRLGAGWDFPANMQSGWDLRPEMVPLRVKAAVLVQQFSSHKLWGWKDPRNSLTLPLWQHLVPEIRVVICLRNPIAVARSLFRRNYFSEAASFNLWSAYNKQLLSIIAPQNRIVTHYDTYFHDPRAELTRILQLLEIDTPQDLVNAAVHAVSLPLQHHRATRLDLVKAKAPQSVVDLYAEMCAESGPIYQLVSEDEHVSHDEPSYGPKSLIPNQRTADLEVKLIEKAQEIPAMESRLAEKEQAIQALSVELAKQEQVVQSLSKQVLSKEQAVQSLSKKVLSKEKVVESLSAHAAQQELELIEIKGSRAWHAGMVLHRLGVLLMPSGSLRARIARKMFAPRQASRPSDDVALIRDSALFDASWYLEQNPDVGQSGMDPAYHYLRFGGFEGRDPSPEFSTSGYLATNQDAEQTRINPLLHYLKHGGKKAPSAQSDALMLQEKKVYDSLTPAATPSHRRASSGDLRTASIYSHSGMDALAYLRLLGPVRRAGLRIINGVEDGVTHVERAIQGDVVVLQRDFPADLATYEEILTLAHREGKPVILELDDLLLELPEDHPDRRSHRYTKALLPMLQALTEVDLVTVATPPLREYVLPYNRNVVVLPNYLNDDLWRLRIPSPFAAQKDVIVIGYMGGITHVTDLDMIVPALLDLDERHPGKLQFRFWGVEPPSELRPRSNVQWFRANGVTYPDFAEYFQRQTADIFIAPLRDNLFNECKSPIKYFEYSAIGAPGVFSRIGPYSSVIADGMNGLLASSLSEWTEALNQLIEDAELRLAIARNAQENIKSKWLLSKNAERWLEAYGMAANAFDGAGPAASAFHGLVKSLTQQVAEERDQKEQEPSESKGSRAWRAGMLLHRLRVLLMPPGSLRARIARKVLGPRQASRPSGDLALIRDSALFDASWYLAQNPDVAKIGMDPAHHYLQFGGFEGRDPSRKFSTSGYLATNQDVEQTRINPLLHYLKYGAKNARPLPRSGDGEGITLKDMQGRKPIVHYLGRAFSMWKEGGLRLVWKQMHLRVGSPISKVFNSFLTYPVDVAASEDEQKQEIENFNSRPLISILMPVYNTPPRYLTKAINSIRTQTYTNFEICICNDGSSDSAVATELQRIWAQDQRVKLFSFAKNNGISAATNQAAELATGDYYALMDHDDELTPNALFEVVQMLNQDPVADVIYSDQDKIDVGGLLSEPFCKPDWSPEFFRGAMYIGHLLVIKKELFHQVGGMLSRFDGVQDYELMLRVSEIARRIRHIPKILYHWRKIPGSIALGVDEKGDRIEERQVKAVDEQLRRLNIPAIATFNPGQRHRVIVLPKPRANFPLVSIIVLAENVSQDIGRCLQSIFSRTSYPNYEVVVVANQSTDGTALEALRSYPVKVVSSKGEPNFSRANSLGVQNARGEFVVFLNNDTEIVTVEWIEVLLSYLEREGVGAVGPMLIYPNHTVQHAGIALGIRGSADHVMRHFPYASDGYAGSLCCPREVSAVTGACMMLRRKDFVELGGLVEYYVTQYQDVDLCLRILRTGRRILYVPHVVLISYESRTREACNDPMDRALFLDTWGEIVARGDPYYNPHFSLETGDYSFKRGDRA